MEIITPKDFVGPLMELSQARRGDFVDMQFLTEARTTLIYNLPLAEASLSHPPFAQVHKTAPRLASYVPITLTHT